MSLTPSVHGQIKDSATGFFNPQQNQQEVFYVGANQHVYEAYNDSHNGWLFIDMTGNSNLAAPSGGVTNVTSFWNPQQNLQEVFYVGANQHVYEAYYSNGWIVEDITGGNNLAALNGSMASFWNPQQNLQEVFYVGANQHVYEAYYSNGWIVEDITGGNNLAALNGSMASFWNPQQNLQEVFYVGTNQHVYEAYYSNGWIVEDISGGNNLAVLNGGIASFWNPQQNLQEVFYVGANQHVYEAYYSNGWIVEDISGGNNLAVLNGGIASFWNPQQNLQEVFYVGANQHVYEAYDNSSGWSLIDMSGSNDLAMVLYTISGRVTAGGSGLSGVTVTFTGNTAAGTGLSQTNTTDSNGNYAFSVPVGGTYTITPSLAGYGFSPASQPFNNVSANQTAQTTTAALQAATCTTQASVSSSSITQGASEIISVSISSLATAVSFTITGANTNPYSNSIPATRVGTSLIYQATLSTSGLLGEYKIVPVINNAGTPYSCTGSVEFFNIVSGTEPTQPPAIKCSSMSGKWTDAASGHANLVWTLTDNAGTISGNVTSQDPCGNQLT